MIELLVVVSIIVILISMMLGGLQLSRKSGRGTVCASNQREIGQAMRTFYAAEKRLPFSTEILRSLGPYLSNAIEVTKCPEIEEEFDVSYGVHPCVNRLFGDSGKIVLLDANEEIVYYEGFNTDEFRTTTAPRHWGEKMNVLKYDGHVEQLDQEETDPYTNATALATLWKPSDSNVVCAPPNGVDANYYTGWWTGTSSKRVDGSLHMPFGGAFFGFDYWDIPLPGAKQGGWDTGSFGSATWTGKVKAKFSEPHTFYLACDNEAWLIVNGQQVIHRNTGGVDGVTTYESAGPITMQAGEWVDIEVRLRELTPGFSPSHVSIFFESASMPRTALGGEYLRVR